MLQCYQAENNEQENKMKLTIAIITCNKMSRYFTIGLLSNPMAYYSTKWLSTPPRALKYSSERDSDKPINELKRVFARQNITRGVERLLFKQ